MNLLSQIINRSSVPAKNLHQPAPTEAELEQILQAAMSAPDHGNLQPYRFLTIRGDARKKLGEIFASAVKSRDPNVSAEYQKKQRDKPLRSPLIIVAIAQIQDNPKIPEIEQMLCAGAATQNILLACHSLGYGAIWLTGDNAYDWSVCEPLGLDFNEKIIGFIYIGTATEATNPRKTTLVENKLQDWKEPVILKTAI